MSKRLLAVRDIPAGGLHLTFEEEPRTFEFHREPRSPADPVLHSPVSVSLDVLKMERNVRLSGRLQYTLGLTCGRCLAAFDDVQRVDFQLLMCPRPAPSLDAPEPTAIDEDEVGWYEGDEIDLAGMVEEQVVLALPVRPLCTVACRGLCEGCGTDLNVEPCRCVRREGDPRFAALRRLRVQ